MEFYFFGVDLYWCVRLLTQICLTLATLYHSKIPLRLIKIKRAKSNNAEQIGQINSSGIFEGYSVVSVRQSELVINERTQPDKIIHILGVHGSADELIRQLANVKPICSSRRPWLARAITLPALCCVRPKRLVVSSIILVRNY